MVKVNELPIDGMLRFGKYATKRDENGKKVGFKLLDPHDLFFNYLSIRQSDTTYFNSIGKTVDLKVKTYYVAGVEQKSVKVLIEGELYDVTMIDPDFKREYMFWYLTKVGVGSGI